MGNKAADPAWRGRRIDDEAKGIFIAALRRGASMEDAARAAGFSPGGFWKARKSDPAFEEAVDDALELSNGPRFISPGNGRPMQLRRIRRLRFLDWRREVFLIHFARTGDETAAAEAAGVSTATICRHRQKDPDFAEACRRALDLCVAALEAEALRQRLEAQRRLRELEFPPAEVTAEFERVMKLLQRWDRKDGSAAVRSISHGRMKSWTFDEAIDAIERKLKAIGVPVREVPDERVDEEVA